MMKTPLRSLPFLLILFCCLPVTLQTAARKQSEQSVKILYFQKSACPACESIRRTVLPELKQHYGNQRTILALTSADPTRGDLYLRTMLELGISPSDPLPLAIIGSSYLSGAETIRRRLPGLIADAASRGGQDRKSVV